MADQSELQQASIAQLPFLETEIFDTRQLPEDGSELSTNAVFLQRQEFLTVRPFQEQVNLTHDQEDEQNGMISTADENQEIHQSDLGTDFYAAAMENVDNCEKEAEQLWRMHNTLRSYFRGKLHADSWCLPSTQSENSHRQGRNDHLSRILRTTFTGLTSAQETCHYLLTDIHKLRKNVTSQGELISDLKEELDQIGAVLGEQQRINKELKRNWDAAKEIIEEQSMQQLLTLVRGLQDENKSLAKQLNQLQSSNDVSEQEQRQQEDEDGERGVNVENYSDEENDIEVGEEMRENSTDAEVFEGGRYIVGSADWDEAYTVSESSLRILNITKEE